MGPLLGCFIQSRKWMSLKFTGKLCIMTMKIDAKFEEELTCHFKIDIKNLTNFDLNPRISWKVYNVWAKMNRGVFLVALNIGVKSEGKLTEAFKNDMRNLAYFHQIMFERLKIATFIGLFYPK